VAAVGERVSMPRRSSTVLEGRGGAPRRVDCGRHGGGPPGWTPPAVRLCARALSLAPTIRRTDRNRRGHAADQQACDQMADEVLAVLDGDRHAVCHRRPMARRGGMAGTRVRTGTPSVACSAHRSSTVGGCGAAQQDAALRRGLTLLKALAGPASLCARPTDSFLYRGRYVAQSTEASRVETG